MITLPRRQMMDVLHFNDDMRNDLLRLLGKRRQENKYFIHGASNAAHAAAKAAMAARTLVRYIRKRVAAKKEASLSALSV